MLSCNTLRLIIDHATGVPERPGFHAISVLNMPEELTDTAFL